MWRRRNTQKENVWRRKILVTEEKKEKEKEENTCRRKTFFNDNCLKMARHKSVRQNADWSTSSSSRQKLHSNSSRDFFRAVPQYTHQMVVWIGSKCTGTFFVAFYVAMCKISVSLTQTRQVSWGAQALIEQDLARTDVNTGPDCCELEE